MGGLAGAVDWRSFHGGQAGFLFTRSEFEVPVNSGQYKKKMQQVLILCEINLIQACVHSAIACDCGQNRQSQGFGEAGREFLSFMSMSCPGMRFQSSFHLPASDGANHRGDALD